MLRHPVGKSSGLRILSLALGIAASVVIARLGGTDVKGISSSYAASNAMFFMVINLDLASQALRRGRQVSNLGSVPGAIFRAWSIYISIAVPGLLVMLLLSIPGEWLVIGAIAYLVGAQAGVAATGITGPVVGAFGAIIQQCGLMLFTVVFWLFDGLNGTTIQYVVVASYLSPLALYLPFMLRARSPSASYGSFRALLALSLQGIPWQVGRFFQMVLQKADTLVVIAVGGAAAAGIYSVGLSTAMLATIVPSQFAMSALHNASHGREINMARAIRGALLAGFGTSVALAAVGYPLVRSLYGEAFESAYWVLLAAAPGAVSYGIIQVQTSLVRMIGKPGELILMSSAGALTMVILLSFLVSWLGPVGAAVAFTSGSITSAIVGAAVLRGHSESSSERRL